MPSSTLQIRHWLLLNQVLLYACLSLFAVITLVPFAWLAIGAFKNNADFFTYTFFPLGDGFMGIAWERLTLENFQHLFVELDFFWNILNSFFISGTSSVAATLFSAMGGYALAKFAFKGRTFLTLVVLSALIIPAPLLLAPLYQLLFQLNLLNSYAGLLLPGLAPAFGIFLFRQACLNSVPTELMEAARIDGCGEVRLFFEMIIPIIRPMLSAFLLISFLQMWNNFIHPQVILQDESKFPLSIAIAQLRGIYATDYGMISAGTLVSILPVMILFLMLQKEFISGLTAGAVKG